MPKSKKCKLPELTRKDIINIAKTIGFDIYKAPFSIEDFKRGIYIEFEHGKCIEGYESYLTNVTNNDIIMTAKIAYAHLIESPLYYDKNIGLGAWEKSLKNTRRKSRKSTRKSRKSTRRKSRRGTRKSRRGTRKSRKSTRRKSRRGTRRKSRRGNRKR